MDFGEERRIISGVASLVSGVFIEHYNCKLITSYDTYSLHFYRESHTELKEKNPNPLNYVLFCKRQAEVLLLHFDNVNSQSGQQAPSIWRSKEVFP